MAVIQKIRNKYGKLAGAIIAIALVGFIFMDAASGRFGDMFGRDSSVMKINGEKIDQKQYQERLQEYETLTAIYSRDRNLDDAARAQINEQAVQFLVYEKAVASQCAKLGLETTKDENNDLIYSVYADPLIQQFKLGGQPVFANPETGQFDPGRVKAFEKQADQIDPTGKAREQWETVKAYVLRNNSVNKFSSAVINGIYYPKYLAQRNAKEQQSMAGIQFVKVPFTSVNDNEIPKVTDADLKDYMNKHAGLFMVDEPARGIEYVSFDIKPSHDDTNKVLTTLNQLKGEFANTNDNESFVKRNTDGRYDSAYVNKKMFMSQYADTLMAQPVGSVYGPYFEGGSYKLTKVVDRKELPDSVKCRHILVKIQDQRKDVRSDSAAKMRLDSAVALIKAGANFDSVVNRFSDDDGSKKTGGEYTFPLQQRVGISKEFGDFIFDGKTGENKIVKVDNDNYKGYHYIEILDQKGIQPAVRLATVSKELFPGNTTVDAAFAAANQFAGKNSTGAAFDNAIKTEHLDKRVADKVKISDYTIQGLGASREIIKWAYAQKIGDVSPVFQLEGRYVVAKLTSIQEKGMVALNETLRPMVENAVKNEKKAVVISDKYKSAGSLDAVAKTSNQPVQHADTINLGSPFVAAIGFAPKLIGYTFFPGFKPNTLSPGLKGQDGVFFEMVQNRWETPANPSQMQEQAMMRVQQQMQIRNALGQMLQPSISKTADVVYHPSNM